MYKKVLNNGLKVIYEYKPSNISSFCIGFEAGANMEVGYNLGTAHAVEHMLFKGTDTLKELEINKLSDEIFGFNNAMTNYPYCIYYGTTLSSDFHRGFKLYSDIILKPAFRKEGFKEEISIINEELKDWKDDLVQYCEDELFYNSFSHRRINELIIGNEESLKRISLEELKSFYDEYYRPNNCVISVVSSLKFEEILYLIEDLYSKWHKDYISKNLKLYERNKTGIYIKHKEGINGAKIKYIYTIHELNEREVNALKVFNCIFGEGTSSLLFDLIRTKNGLVYDIGSTIKNEKGIKIFNIDLSTSEKNIDIVLQLINELLEKVKSGTISFTQELIKKSIKSLRLKRELKLEKSIELCKYMAVNEIMYGSQGTFYEELDNFDDINEEDIIDVIIKVLDKPSIQIIKP
ncbi:M16 family metallopeptidase [Candidatus Clostridium radicumherbarum]|uniref:M16 family metallopeptidase n=1 Tax=Candidatus Clostridium radicumherbarum TaxID=3381662 RepID=A0ABW8U0X8_9CLOT